MGLVIDPEVASWNPGSIILVSFSLKSLKLSAFSFMKKNNKTSQREEIAIGNNA